jgi:hypothetical protein
VCRLHVKLEQQGNNIPPIKLVDYYPPEAVIWETHKGLATVELGKHVVFRFKQVSWGCPLVFVLGVINGYVWWHRARDWALEGHSAEKSHRQRDPFSANSSFEGYHSYIVDDDKEKELDGRHQLRAYSIQLEQKGEEFFLNIQR